MPIRRIILDTNWLVSASINRASRRQLYNLIINENLEILYSKELLTEYSEVISREKFKKYISKEQARRFIRVVFPLFLEIDLKSKLQVSKDPDDNYLLAMSVDGQADFLITGDPDLLVLKSVGNTKIVKMSTFLSML